MQNGKGITISYIYVGISIIYEILKGVIRVIKIIVYTREISHHVFRNERRIYVSSFWF